jgi:hypothetical protein
MRSLSAVALALCLPLPVYLAAACGSSGGATTTATTTTSGVTGTTVGAGGSGSGGKMASTATTTGTGGHGGEAMTGGGGNGGGGNGGAGGAGGTGGAAVCVALADPCTMCAFANCNASYCACYTDPNCNSIVMCNDACDNNPNEPMGCTNDCFVGHGQGTAKEVIASQCAAMNCATACPQASEVKPCELCIAQECATQLGACFNTQPCLALVQCVRDCSSTQNMPCVDMCAAMNPQGIALAMALVQCANTTCETPCMSGF